jgi:hypothetical protein
MAIGMIAEGVRVLLLGMAGIFAVMGVIVAFVLMLKSFYKKK